MSYSITTKQFNDALTKQTNDISDILQSFMQQVGDEFAQVHRRLDTQAKKYN